MCDGVRRKTHAPRITCVLRVQTARLHTRFCICLWQVVR